MIPVLSVQQMREWEKATWATGQSAERVIQLVGRRLAQRIVELSRPGDAIWIVAGKGHNGDDARAAVPDLNDRIVTLFNVTDPRQGRDEFLERIRLTPGHPPNWIIDALFGIGLS